MDPNQLKSKRDSRDDTKDASHVEHATTPQQSSLSKRLNLREVRGQGVQDKGDPRPELRAVLHFLSDIELSKIIVSRLSQATKLYAPPLYLSFPCLEGVYNFFRPRNSTTSLFLDEKNARSSGVWQEGLSGTSIGHDVQQHANIDIVPKLAPTGLLEPFHELLPLTGQGASRRKGVGTGSLHQGINDGASAVSPVDHVIDPPLVRSLVTFLSFLDPPELRRFILKRLDEAEGPYEELRYLVEFLQSGGDVPQGLKIKANIRARRQYYRALKKMRGPPSNANEGGKGNGQKDQLAAAPKGQSAAAPPGTRKKQRRKKKPANIPSHSVQAKTSSSLAPP